MFRHLNIVSALQGLRFLPNSTSNLIVRWRRKPRWLPVAPSKKFRIPVKQKIPEDEEKEILRLHNFYRTQMRGIRTLLLNEVEQAEIAAKSSLIGSDSEAAEHARCMAINDKWNKNIVAVREARLAQQAKQRAERALKGMSVYESAIEKKKQMIEQAVLKEKAVADSYITADNLDAAIEEALNSTVDYNYVIDLQGNIVYGRETRLRNPDTKEPTV